MTRTDGRNDAPTWAEQKLKAYGAKTFEIGVERMNALVTPCPPKPRLWWRLWWQPQPHRFEDYTGALNTITYTTLDRCRDCGYCVLGSGL